MAAQTEALLQQMQEQIAALQIDLAASAAATLAATNAAAAATTALAGLPPTGAPNLGTAAPNFALSPASMANAEAFLNLATSTGAKLFKLGAELLSRSFDFVDPSDLQVFLDLLKTKSKVQGWSRIFTVPVEVDGVTTHHSLLHNYGVIPLASVALDAATYVNAQSKVAQDSFKLFQCIFASLRTDFLKLVTTEALHYHILDTKAPHELQTFLSMSSRGMRLLRIRSLLCSSSARMMPMTKGKTSLSLPLWMLLRTSSRPGCSSKLGVHQPRNKNRS
jgi:hypothetical protein